MGTKRQPVAVMGVSQLDAFSSSAHTFRPPTVETLIPIFRQALRLASSRRQPVVIEVPSDLFGAKVQFSRVDPDTWTHQVGATDSIAIERAARLLTKAKRPALLVGTRCAHRNLTKTISDLVDRFQLPCASVDYAKGVIREDHPLYLGVLGFSGHASTYEYFSTADVVLTLGVRFTEATTSGGNTGLFSNLIQVDEHAEEIGRFKPVRIGITGNLSATCEQLAASAVEASRSEELHSTVAELKAKYSVYQPVDEPRACSSPGYFQALREALPRDTLVVGDTGLTMQFLKQSFPVYAPDGFFALYAFAPMGSSLPLALGVQLEREDVPVVAVLGDGGMLLHLGELSALAQSGAPLIVIVMNNKGYKQVGDRMRIWCQTTIGCEIDPVDYAHAARAQGCDGHRAESPDHLRELVTQALATSKLTVIEVQPEGDSLLDVTDPRLAEWFKERFQETRGLEWPLFD